MIEVFHDKRTATLTYVVHEQGTAIVIDPVLDYEPVGSALWTESVDAVIAFLKKNSLDPKMILETHAHADHLSGAQLIKKHFPNAVVAIGDRIKEVQKVFKQIFDLPEAFPVDGSQFDRLLKDGESVDVGPLSFKVISTPGHTPACSSYAFDDVVFVGDALFMPDVGTGRCDFPGGSAADLYNSIVNKLYALPDDTRVFTGHDYPNGRSVQHASTIKEQKENNVALPAVRNEADFVTWRNARDASLAAPKLLFQSVQVNVDAGRVPTDSDNERQFLKIPLNVFRPPENSAAVLELNAVERQ